MAEVNETQLRSVSLPARGFEMDVLQANLDAAHASLGEGGDFEEVMRAAVEASLAPGQPSLDVDPAAMEGYAVVQVAREDGKIAEVRVYVPEDAKPAQLEAIMLAGVDGDMVLNQKGKAIDAPVPDAGGDAETKTAAPAKGSASQGN